MKPRQAIAEIKQLIDGTTGGRDEYASNKILACCTCLRSHRANSEKIAEIEQWAKDYFSGKSLEPQRYMNIAVWVSTACDVIESRLPPDGPCSN